MSDEHSVKTMCALFEVSRSGYYAWSKLEASARAKQNAALKERIAQIHAQSRGTYGSPRVTVELREQGERVGRHRVARLMRSSGLKGRQRRRYRVMTTDSSHNEPIAPNHLGQIAPPQQPDRVWVSDITYVPTAEGWLYLAGVMDQCSRFLVGWAMGESLETSLPVAAMQMALQRRRPPKGLLHHSDRGVQYASAPYRALLADNYVIASMSRRGNCYDNATMEAFWSTLKNELIYRCHFETRADARTAIFDYIEGFYNRSRRHSALGYKSPLAFESNLN
jgi:putative transposase